MSKNKSLGASIVGVLTSILAFFGMVTCCGMPIIAGTLSLLGIGASQLSFFAKYQWWFIVISIACLAWGFIQIYGNESECGCCCQPERNISNSKNINRIIAKSLLWIGSLMTVSVIIYNITTSSQSSDSCCSEESSSTVLSDGCSDPQSYNSKEIKSSLSEQSCCGGEEIVDTNNCCNQN